MSILKQPPLRVVLYEGEKSAPLTSEERFSTLQALLEKGYRVTSIQSDALMAEPSVDKHFVILGKFETRAAAQTDHDVELHFQDVRGKDTAGIVALVDEVRDRTTSARQGEWKPWFPVIDYDRCTNCMQCLSFCLFGVYGVDEEKRIQVQNNDNCKTNCPACSRVCPEAAIMFPKYKAGPINGDLVSESDLQREKMKIDISALLGGDIYQMLRDRSEKAKSRFSKERDSDKALLERQKCLVKLQQQISADIPPEVLMSLPSPDEIKRRAAEASAKAQAALAN